MAELRYESSELPRRGLTLGATTLLATLAFGVVVAAAMAWAFWPSKPAEPAPSWPSPGLDPALPATRAAIEATWDARAEAYGWVDRGAGVARIPVERAEELYLQGTRSAP